MRDARMAKQPLDHEDFGVLVGWTHSHFADRLDLRLQTVRSSRQRKPADIDNHHIVMTAGQAVLLANYLFEVTGQTKPGARKGRLKRWFAA
jgi:hypothetical protein